jgi:hypothetical protein
MTAVETYKLRFCSSCPHKLSCSQEGLELVSCALGRLQTSNDGGISR